MKRRTALWLCCLPLWMGCGPADEGTGSSASAIEEASTSPAPWPADEGLGTLSFDGNYWVSVLFHGEAVFDGEIPLNEDFEVEVRLFDGATKTRRIDDVELRVDARMPSHGHGMKQDALAKLQEDGSWRATPMLMHMTGPWELHVDVTRGALTERAQFEIELE